MDVSQLIQQKLTEFGMDQRDLADAAEIVLNRRIAPASLKNFEFVEKQVGRGSLDEEPGFREFLKDHSLSEDATPEEIDFLRHLRFKNSRHPTPLYYYRVYYYRELQNLRAPLHFRRK